MSDIGSRWSLPTRRLYLCTADRPDLEQFLSACISGGVDIVQLRDKELDDRALVERGRLARAVCADHGVPFILNDRPDLVAETGADGVHVGQDDMGPEATRDLVGSDALVGLSSHATGELDAAIGGPEASPAPVDYLSAGPVSATPTKPGRPGTGLGYVHEAVARSPWPVWITGGVAPDTVGAMLEAGGRHFVVVRWLTEAPDPAAHAHALRQAIDEGIERADSRS
ncbi:MAG TPA: thiamine phosphate synthase [Acidimicrobiales bacterium]|nr:thiamine phosphate synthase [Acidimicrobiales bacterium]